MGATAYIHVKNFKAGLNRGGTRISTEAGSLWTLVNAHLNRNGDIIGRKKFVSKFTLPVGTFGFHALNDELFTFGSADLAALVPAGVSYQRLQHPDPLIAMSDVLDVENFDGQIYVIAEFADDAIFHYYDGVIVPDWLNGIVRADMTNNDGIAEHLRALINASAEFSATRSGSVITVTGADTSDFTTELLAENGEGNALGDQSLAENVTQEAIEGQVASAAVASFRVSGGTSNPGVNKIASVTIDGVEVLSTAVDWATSHTATAAAIAAQINAFNSSPEYTATSDGQLVLISPTVAGSAANGRVISISFEGTVDITNAVNMAGGTDAVTGQAKITEITVGGTFEVGDRFTIKFTKDQVLHIFGADGNPTPVGRTLQTFKSKLYSTVSSLLFFSAVNNALGWNRDDADNAGANFINMASQDEGSQVLYGTESYQGNMAVFSRRSIQLWAMDPDEELNVFLQPLKNTGSRSGKSILSFGNNDVFYLSDVGIRSLRARDSSNAAYVSDVGNAIDPLITAHMLTLTDAEIEGAVAILEPEDDRYCLALGTRIYTFSFFPGSKVSAWSYYDISTDIGGQITEFARTSNRLYARSGQVVYIYGGDSGVVYPGVDEAIVEVDFPWLDAGSPATPKVFRGVKIGARGVWDVSVAVDPSEEDDALTSYVNIGSIVGTNFSKGRSPGEFSATHFAPKLVASRGGFVSLSAVSIVYDDPHEPGGKSV